MPQEIRGIEYLWEQAAEGGGCGECERRAMMRLRRASVIAAPSLLSRATAASAEAQRRTRHVLQPRGERPDQFAHDRRLVEIIAVQSERTMVAA